MFNVDASAPAMPSGSPAPVPRSVGAIRPVGHPRRLEGDLLDRILGRCGRVADTADPSRYGKLFTVGRELLGQRLRWGIMVPANLFLDGVVHHPAYRQKRTPQMAPMAVFKRNAAVWTARAVLFVRPEEIDGEAFEREIVSLYADFGVEAVILRPQTIDSRFLDTADFRCRLNRAVYAPCAVSPQFPPTPPPPCHIAVA
jgi:hypothetical protein